MWAGGWWVGEEMGRVVWGGALWLRLRGVSITLRCALKRAALCGWLGGEGAIQQSRCRPSPAPRHQALGQVSKPIRGSQAHRQRAQQQPQRLQPLLGSAPQQTCHQGW